MIKVTLEVDDLVNSLTLDYSEGVVVTHADAYTLSSWVEQSVWDLLGEDDRVDD